MSKLTVVFNDISSGGQSAFPLYAIPGDIILPFIDGVLVTDYTVSGSTFSLPVALVEGKRVVIYSTQGGSVTSEVRLNELLSQKADYNVVLGDLSTKLDKAGGNIGGRISLAHDPIGLMEPVTLGYLQSLPSSGLVWSDIEAILDSKASKIYVDSIIGDMIPKTEKGQPGGVASLNASGQIHSGQLYAGIFTNVYTVASDADMLTTGAEVGDFVLRTDKPRRTFVKADGGSDLASFKEISTSDSAGIDYVPQNLLTQTNVQGALAEAESKISTLSGGNSEHLTDYTNPHQVTHAQTVPAPADPAIADITRNKHLSNNDMSKLEGIEAGATADQTANEIMGAMVLGHDTRASTDGPTSFPIGESHMLAGVGAWPELPGTVITSQTNGNNVHQLFKQRDSGRTYYRNWDLVALAWLPWKIADPAPIGTVHQYAGTSDPNPIYMTCNGRALSRTTYADLFNVISTRFGAGDGSTTFNIPDCRGRTPIGAGQGVGLSNRSLGNSVGAENHTLITAQMPSHNHAASASNSAPHGSHAHNTFGNYQSNTSTGGSAGRINNLWASSSHNGLSGGIGGTNGSGALPTDHSHNISVGNTGEGQSHNNVQPSIVLTMIIKVIA